ncbi:zinc ribbon-containing (seleno)protein DG [Desulfotalea psychrophila]|uniref:Putative zinc-ribbon domain-containing protein n=1 Tax=Desulfotalea psychrophila (strain LSv54 / DSM 12343) TaxID=177439 RepID=Q6AJQ7_DESPS|nr:zinc ribbon domain-containing protein [Desulfotalea psychrophila]CAG37423.1 unknown protein [Desulfotalea psychrophila LSv54]
MGFLARIFAGDKASCSEQDAVLAIDIEMMYCPVCDEEYRGDMTHCVSCDVELITGEYKRSLLQQKMIGRAPRSMLLRDDEAMLTLQKGPMKEMKHLKTLLARVEIPARLLSDDPALGKCCGGPQLYLQVRETDRDEASQILHQDFQKSTHLASHNLVGMDRAIDEGRRENSCPACGHLFTTGQPCCPDCGLVFSA